MLRWRVEEEDATKNGGMGGGRGRGEEEVEAEASFGSVLDQEYFENKIQSPGKYYC